ncbi:MAG: capsule biosynthesis protein [Sphingomonas bacterium]|jgi:poly-gamma-glutamate capsule biosynthesis protein CapA/YwtB (metallophosphatase superfamily)|nr:CapA family protein [Sphingomonas bacterium]MDB5689618.1 capsule biosynthesis protein [Sphingomonas bacterium]
MIKYSAKNRISYGRISCYLAASLAALCAPLGAAIAQDADAINVQPVPSTPVEDGFTFAAVGDFIYLRPMMATLEKQSPDMLAILRGASVTFANFETSAFDIKTFKGAPQAESGGTWMLGDPRVAEDAAKMGIDIVSHANNHSTDWGVEGLIATLEHLDEAGLVYSGTGRSLSEARAPAYLDTAYGRVGLVSASTSFTPMSRAADPVGNVPGRGGVNYIRLDRVGLVAPADLAVLARLAGAPAGDSVRFANMRFQASPAALPADGAQMVSRFDVNAADERANLLSVRQAKGNGNFVAFSLHNHEPGNGSQKPTDSIVEFAHKVIDAGGDAYVGHGPHQLRGIEIYKGKPIFYSLGNFAMMNNSLDVIPADMYDQYGVVPGAATVPELLQARNARSFGDPVLFESLIAVSRYAGGVVKEVRLYPVDLGVSASGAARGVPKMADGVVGRRILERMQKLSAPFGTTITIEKGIGVIRPRTTP